MSISRHQAVGAYRRWEPPDFDAEDARAARTRPAPPPADAPPAGAEAAELPPGVKLPTAEEIERLHEEVRAAAFEEGQREGQRQGFEAGQRAGVEAGRSAGLEAGYAEGYAAGQAQAADEAARIGALASDLEQAISGLDREVAEELMGLAIEMARQMVRSTLAQHPESILETIRSALAQLPQGSAHIRLNAEDLALVRAHLGESPSGQPGHRLQEDAGLGRGEFRIDTGGAQIDGTLETRWRRVLESIGRERARWQLPEADGNGGGA